VTVLLPRKRTIDWLQDLARGSTLPSTMVSWTILRFFSVQK